MSPQSYLSVLAIVGFSVGLFGAAISLLRKTSSEVEGSDKKRLTPFGWFALAMSILGFAGSFASELLKIHISAQQDIDARRAKETAQREKDEAEKWQQMMQDLSKNILINTRSAIDQTIDTKFKVVESKQRVRADNLRRETRLYGRLSATGAPLTSLVMTLTVDHVPAEFIASIRKTREAVRDNIDFKYRHWVPPSDAEIESQVQASADSFIPQFIAFLGTDEFIDEQGLLVIGFDNEFSAIVCIGQLDHADADPDWFPTGIRLSSPAQTQIKKVPRPEVHIYANNDESVTLTIYMSVNSLRHGVLRYSPNAASTAALASNLQLFVWVPGHIVLVPTGSGEHWRYQSAAYRELPFDSGGVHDWFTLTDPNDLWSDAKKWAEHIKLHIIPNGIEQISRTYDMVPSVERGQKDGGLVRLWDGSEVKTVH